MEVQPAVQPKQDSKGLASPALELASFTRRLNGRDVPVLKAVRAELLAALPLRLAAEIAV